MRTTEEIKSRIQGIRDEYQACEFDTAKQKLRANKKASKEVAWLQVCLLYLETNPSDEFIRKMLVEKERLLEYIMSDQNFSNWLMLHPGASKQDYFKDLGRQVVVNQITALKYLLK